MKILDNPRLKMTISIGLDYLDPRVNTSRRASSKIQFLMLHLRSFTDRLVAIDANFPPVVVVVVVVAVSLQRQPTFLDDTVLGTWYGGAPEAEVQASGLFHHHYCSCSSCWNQGTLMPHSKTSYLVLTAYAKLASWVEIASASPQNASSVDSP